MTNLWPWMAVAGYGVLHGLNPATGWMFAAAWGVHARDGTQVRRALLLLAIGHAAAIAVVACVFAQGMSLDRALVQGYAGALLVVAASYRVLRGSGRRAISTQTGHAGIALWSFLMATAHGAGIMLLPALASMCLAGNSAREITAPGSLVLALAAVGVHMAAMLATTGAIATGVCRGVALHPRLLNHAVLRQTWTTAMAITGAMLIALR